MENQLTEKEKAANEINQYAVDLLVNEKKGRSATIDALVEKGLDTKTATTIVDNLREQILLARKETAKKDILYGTLWCIGGLIATVADVGYIFWGAIVFGGAQLLKGVINSF